MKPKLIVIEGTTASGKSGLGVELAAHYGGEIISADSRQVFRGLDLGSGKITPEETQGVKHHLIDVVDPNDFYSMHDFQRMAYEAIDDVLARGKIPFLVGGTGLYVASVTEGYVMSNIEPDLEYRAHLETMETPKLYEMLLSLRPDVQVDPKNRNRVMRMLEKIHDGDDHESPNQPRYDCLKLGCTYERSVLRDRIDERLKMRVELGMIEEVQRLLSKGATVDFMLRLGLEYRFVTQYLTGVIPDRDEMLSLLATAIKQFAKRQMIWYRRDKDIQWLDMTADPKAQGIALIDDFLKN